MAVDWIALASVVTSGVVGISAKATDALTKRGDQKFESKREYEKRVWDAKSAALTTVIAVCLDISGKCELRTTGSPKIDPERNRRTLALHALDRAHERFDADGVTGAVVAFSTDSMRRQLRSLLSTIDAERRTHADDLAEIRRANESIGDIMDRLGALDISTIGTSEDNDLWGRPRSQVKRSAAAEDHMVDNCDLDIEALKRVSESVIAEARKDLRGG